MVWASVEGAIHEVCGKRDPPQLCTWGFRKEDEAVKSTGFGGQVDLASNPHVTPFHCGTLGRLPNFSASIPSSAE